MKNLFARAAWAGVLMAVMILGAGNALAQGWPALYL